MSADDTDVSDIPAGLRVDRHRDWAGRSRYLWIKRVITAVLVVFIALALLNVFGQRASATSISAPAASLEVTTPHDLRLGLIYQTQLQVVAHRVIAHPRVVLGPGWFDGATLNSMEPGAAAEAPTPAGGTAFTYPPLPPGRTLTLWLEWSANPTHVAWNRPQVVQVYDGRSLLVAHIFHVTVFP